MNPTGPTPSAPDVAEQQQLFDLLGLVDDLLETVLRERRSLVRAMELVLPRVIAQTGALGAFVRTYGEDLILHRFVWPKDLEHRAIESFCVANQAEPELGGAFSDDDVVLVAQGLDVAGEWFGSAGLLVRKEEATEARTRFLGAALRVVCEQLDNYLYSVKAAREKHRVVTALAHALQNRVLSAGLHEAVRILAENVSLEKLAIVLRSDQSPSATVHVQVFEGSTRIVDTMSGAIPAAETAAIEADGRAYLGDESRALLARYGFDGAQEEVLIHGITETTLVGKVVVSSRSGDFNTYDRDLLAGFGDFICQRVVDFNKEYRNLARSFRPVDVDRMLRTSDYVERYLRPREQNVVMLYVDVAGFTRVCEQILVDPNKIGMLVDLWGEKAVEILWEHGGVFDKMVGDCIIGLFGPPFYERSAPALIQSALEAALAIRAMTNALPEVPELSMLRAEGLAVSTGVNYAPLFVGTFGPNENFTGFSAGMNNTARLQAQAGRNEILLMDDAAALLPEGHPYALGELQSARVKNVANPLTFRAVERLPR
ncbi:MAG: adenylate/guanylate cyclase domain-containing protein [Minicystis sp.]